MRFGDENKVSEDLPRFEWGQSDPRERYSILNACLLVRSCEQSVELSLDEIQLPRLHRKTNARDQGRRD